MNNNGHENKFPFWDLLGSPSEMLIAFNPLFLLGDLVDFPEPGAGLHVYNQVCDTKSWPKNK